MGFHGIMMISHGISLGYDDFIMGFHGIMVIYHGISWGYGDFSWDSMGL